MCEELFMAEYYCPNHDMRKSVLYRLIWYIPCLYILLQLCSINNRSSKYAIHDTTARRYILKFTGSSTNSAETTNISDNASVDNMPLPEDSLVRANRQWNHKNPIDFKTSWSDCEEKHKRKWKSKTNRYWDVLCARKKQRGILASPVFESTTSRWVITGSRLKHLD